MTWCVGHLVSMSYPDAYDPSLKRWSLGTLPFIPKTFQYEVIPAAEKQFRIVSGLLNRADVERIYVCTDSGREGEYIYRLVEQQAGVKGKEQKRVWIDSQTEEEILRGIREAKDLSEYDNLAASAYLRAKEDYLMGINFSRVLTLKYGDGISGYLGQKRSVVSVGRVMTCVLGMVVKREREIRAFTETPFYRVLGYFREGGAETASGFGQPGGASARPALLEGEWRAAEGSKWRLTPGLYKDNGFLEEKKAKELVSYLSERPPAIGKVTSLERKKEKKNPPLLFNLAELQNECARRFKISPDETLRVAQELYEKKLVTYPRTDARVLSSAVAKEISKNLNGLMKYAPAAPYLQEIARSQSHKKLGKTRYVNDRQITDHYAIIPTGQGLGAWKGLPRLSMQVYDLIVRRFLGIFYPPAEYQKISLAICVKGESFFAGYRTLVKEGYLKVAGDPRKSKDWTETDADAGEKGETGDADKEQALSELFGRLKKGAALPVQSFEVREGKTSPPKRYHSGSLILAMENAGQLIEDEELRAQIKGSGIGTSATRGEILKKLVHNQYLSLNKKTQVVTPTLQGEMIFEVVDHSIRPLLNPELTASWEKGLAYVAEGAITSEEYMEKLSRFVSRHTQRVKGLDNQYELRQRYDKAAAFYKKSASQKKNVKTGGER